MAERGHQPDPTITPKPPQQRWRLSDTTQAALISAAGTIVAALIGGVFLVWAGYLHVGPSDAASPSDPATTPMPTQGATGVSPPASPPSASRSLRTTYLADLEPAREGRESAWTNGPVTLDGRDYTHGMKASDFCGNQDVREYPLSGRYGRFKGIAGFADDSEETQPTSFKITADSKTVLSGVIRLRAAIHIDLDVHGVVRLGILVDTDEAAFCDGTHTVALGDPRLES